MDLKSLFMQQGQPAPTAPPMDPPAPSPYNLYGYGDPPAPPPPPPPEAFPGANDLNQAMSPHLRQFYGAEGNWGQAPAEQGVDPRLMDQALKAAEETFHSVLQSAGSAASTAGGAVRDFSQSVGQDVRELGQEIGPRAHELGDEARDLSYRARQGASLKGHQALQAGKNAWNSWFHPQGNEPDYLIRPHPGQTQSPRRR